MANQRPPDKRSPLQFHLQAVASEIAGQAAVLATTWSFVADKAASSQFEMSLSCKAATDALKTMKRISAALVDVTRQAELVKARTVGSANVEKNLLDKLGSLAGISWTFKGIEEGIDDVRLAAIAAVRAPSVGYHNSAQIEKITNNMITKCLAERLIAELRKLRTANESGSLSGAEMPLLRDEAVRVGAQSLILFTAPGSVGPIVDIKEHPAVSQQLRKLQTNFTRTRPTSDSRIPQGTRDSRMQQRKQIPGNSSLPEEEPEDEDDEDEAGIEINQPHLPLPSWLRDGEPSFAEDVYEFYTSYTGDERAPLAQSIVKVPGVEGFLLLFIPSSATFCRETEPVELRNLDGSKHQCTSDWLPAHASGLVRGVWWTEEDEIGRLDKAEIVENKVGDMLLRLAATPDFDPTILVPYQRSLMMAASHTTRSHLVLVYEEALDWLRVHDKIQCRTQKPPASRNGGGSVVAENRETTRRTTSAKMGRPAATQPKAFCEDGDDCTNCGVLEHFIDRHALPSGFVLKCGRCVTEDTSTTFFAYNALQKHCQQCHGGSTKDLDVLTGQQLRDLIRMKPAHVRKWKVQTEFEKLAQTTARRGRAEEAGGADGGRSECSDDKEDRAEKSGGGRSFDRMKKKRQRSRRKNGGGNNVE